MLPRAGVVQPPRKKAAQGGRLARLEAKAPALELLGPSKLADFRQPPGRAFLRRNSQILLERVELGRRVGEVFFRFTVGGFDF